MPTVIRIGHFRFHFYSDEGSEPPHIHVRSPDGECKFWLEPIIILASNRGIVKFCKKYMQMTANNC
ncbi:DUF4160 domain-containing protein [Microcystis aeruginosa]|uniref:DUF4160 domain-containing protein n=1 Tax=Microcystis aeruginosa TaxID=1126 RepID=UPI00132F844D|nr:DUF4160 domain-containing protein [Microcystis aeruginosa]